MADTTDDDLVQAVRNWLKLVLATSFTLSSGETIDDRIIVADEEGPRPTPPYIVVRMSNFDQAVGSDHQFVDAAGCNEYIEGAREDTVSIHGYGRGIGNLMRDAKLSLWKDAVKAQNATDGVSIETVGGLQNLSQLVDTDTEERFLLDVYVRYRVTSDPTPAIPLQTVQVETEIEGNPPPALTFTFTLP